MNTETKSPSIQLVVSVAQAEALLSALDTYVCLCLGQIEVTAELVNDATLVACASDRQARRPADPDVVDAMRELMYQAKTLLGHPRSGNHGVGHRHVHITGHRAYEILKVLQKVVAEQRNPTPTFRGVNYDGLSVRYTTDPVPFAEVVKSLTLEAKPAGTGAPIGESPLGYFANGQPIYDQPRPRGLVTQACILCTDCQAIIRTTGGPAMGSLCASCYVLPFAEPMLTDAMVMRGAEHLHDAGVRFEGNDATEQQQALAESLYRAMASVSPPAGIAWIDIRTKKPNMGDHVVYWHTSPQGSYLAIADEWLDRDHLKYASHWALINTPE